RLRQRRAGARERRADTRAARPRTVEACEDAEADGRRRARRAMSLRSAMSDFPAFVAKDYGDGRIRGRVERLTLADLPIGTVTIDVEYSSLNFKDALAATGQNKVAAGYPHVPGIDAAGTVVESQDAAWKVGDRVLVHAYDFGAGRFG